MRKIITTALVLVLLAAVGSVAHAQSDIIETVEAEAEVMVSSDDAALVQQLLELILDLQRKIQAILDQMNETPPAPPKPEPYPLPEYPECPTFEYDFRIGSTDAATNGEVTQLQEFLRAEGAFDADATGYYGPITDAAVKEVRARRGVLLEQESADMLIFCPPHRYGLRVISPNGGERWEMGETVKIAWENSGLRRKPLPVAEEEATMQNVQMITGVAYSESGSAPVSESGATMMARPIGSHVRITLQGSSPWCDVESDIRDCVEGYSVYTIAERAENTGAYKWRVGDTDEDYDGLPREGAYRIVIEDVATGQTDRSDRPFKIGGEQKRNSDPVIREIEGPTKLTVGHQGKWRIRAYDPDNDSLRYRVFWGDELDAAQMSGDSAAVFERHVQDSSFTHRYNRAGTYEVEFMVSDSYGNGTQASMTVDVVGKECPSLIPPVIDDPYCGYSAQYGDDGCIIGYIEWCADSIHHEGSD